MLKSDPVALYEGVYDNKHLRVSILLLYFVPKPLFSSHGQNNRGAQTHRPHSFRSRRINGSINFHPFLAHNDSSFRSQAAVYRLGHHHRPASQLASSKLKRLTWESYPPNLIISTPYGRKSEALSLCKCAITDLRQ